jgi:Zn-dependent protease
MTDPAPGPPTATGPRPEANPRDTPFGLGVSLGRWAGVPIRAHWSVLIALVLFAGIISTVDLPGLRPGLSVTAYWVTGVITALVFFLTLLAHELAHAITARRYHLRVRRITLWMLGGLTELEGEPPSPKADALVAASGPLTSLALAGIFGASRWLLGGSGLTATALGWLAAINVALAVFNLLPGAPLDGGRLLRALLWWHSQDRARAARQAAGAGRILGMVLIGLGVLETLAGFIVGLWTALIGWFIVNGAASERYAVRAEQLHGLTVRDAMTPTPVIAPDWWTVEEFVAGLPPEEPKQPVFPLVGVDGGFRGAFTLQALEAVPPERRPATRLHGVAGNTDRLLLAAPGDDLSHLVLPLHLRGGIAIVVEAGHPVGVITENDLARTAQLVGLGWTRRKGAAPPV